MNKEERLKRKLKLLGYFQTIFLTLSVMAVIVMAYFVGVESQKCSNGNHLWLREFENVDKQISDRISPDKILGTKTQLVIKGDYSLAEYSNTDSMLPLLDVGSTGIQMDVTDNMTLNLGDIVSYKSERSEFRIVHRIIGAGEDSEGEYYVLKGDNFDAKDPEKVRRSQIEKVLVGVIW